MNTLLKDAVKYILPSQMYLFLRYIWLKFNGGLEDEMLYVDKLLKRKRGFLDIGANFGIYSYFFSKKFKCIEAFEPLAELTKSLNSLNYNNLNIHNLAISDKEGIQTMSIPIIDGELVTYLATLEPRNCQRTTINVEVKPMDSFGFKDVDLIKIDVEGHEGQVLSSAINTIKTSKPIIIIEIEQRHIGNYKDMTDIFTQLNGLGYDGFFLNNGSLESISKFSYKKKSGAIFRQCDE